MNSGDKIKFARERLGWSQAELAKRANTSQANVQRIESGLVKYSRHTAAIFEALGIQDNDAPTNQAQLVPMVGYVGAGAEIYSIDDHEKGNGLDEIEVPAGVMSLSSVAVVVRGDSMLPVYRSGDVLFYDRQFRGNLDHIIGKTCVIRLLDGRIFVKDLFKSGPAYILMSYNAEPIVAAIDWAAPIIWVKKA